MDILQQICSPLKPLGNTSALSPKLMPIKNAYAVGMSITPLDPIRPWIVALIIHRCSLYHCPAQLTLIFEISRQQTLSPWGGCPLLELLKSMVFVGVSWLSGLLHCNGAIKAIMSFYMVVMLLTIILISIPSFPHSFIPGLKPSFYCKSFPP